MDHLFVLAFLKVILSKDDVLAPSSTFWIWDRINIAFQINPSLRVIEISELTIIIDINTDFLESSPSTELTKQPRSIHIDPITTLTQEFEPLDPRQDSSIEIEQLESHLNNHILHRVI